MLLIKDIISLPSTVYISMPVNIIVILSYNTICTSGSLPRNSLQDEVNRGVVHPFRSNVQYISPGFYYHLDLRLGPRHQGFLLFLMLLRFINLIIK